MWFLVRLREVANSLILTLPYERGPGPGERVAPGKGRKLGVCVAMARGLPCVCPAPVRCPWRNA